MRIATLDGKDPFEIIPITFDFQNLVTAIDSVTLAITLSNGTDPNVAQMLYNTAVVSGTQVTQLIRNGVDNAVYRIRADIVSGNEKYAMVIQMPVLEIS